MEPESGPDQSLARGCPLLHTQDPDFPKHWPPPSTSHTLCISVEGPCVGRTLSDSHPGPASISQDALPIDTLLSAFCSSHHGKAAAQAHDPPGAFNDQSHKSRKAQPPRHSQDRCVGPFQPPGAGEAFLTTARLWLLGVSPALPPAGDSKGEAP